MAEQLATRTLALRKPLDQAAELALREPTAGELEAAAVTPNAIESNIILLAAVTGIDEAALRGLSARDFQEASAWLGQFTRMKARPALPAEDTTDLELVVPVTFQGGSYAKLSLAEPTAGQLEAATNTANSVTSNVILISKVAKVPLLMARELSARDFRAASEWLAGFTAGGPETGETSSQA